MLVPTRTRQVQHNSFLLCNATLRLPLVVVVSAPRPTVLYGGSSASGVRPAPPQALIPPREIREEQSNTTEQHVSRRILGKTAPQERAVAVTTQEGLDGPREKTMRIVSVENDALVSISSAGALDMMHCDFGVRSARDEMRHIFGSSEADVIIGSEQEMQEEGQGPLRIHVRIVRSTGSARSPLRACADIRSEDHGHARDENSSSGFVHVRAGRRRRWRTQGSSTQACERSPTRDKLECGSEAIVQGRTSMLRSTRTTQS